MEYVIIEWEKIKYQIQASHQINQILLPTNELLSVSWTDGNPPRPYDLELVEEYVSEYQWSDIANKPNVTVATRLAQVWQKKN